MEWVVLYGALGAFVGFMAGLLGVSGGGILIPLLVMIFRYQGMDTNHVVHYALGTAFSCMILSSIASIKAHAARGNIEWGLFYGMGSGILIGMFLTIRIAVHIHSVYIALFFVCFMALIAVQMFMNWQPKPSSHPIRHGGLFLIGIGIGSVSALAAVGGGFLTITYLTYKNIPMKKAIGTSAAIGLPIAVVGTLGYIFSDWGKSQEDPYTVGFVYIPAFLAISVMSIISASYGASFAQRLSDAYLKKIFAVVCVILSLKMLFSVI
jgi:uncharacterized membrane protein YfcA